MPRGRDDGLGWNPDAVEPMELTEPTEPMELTEPMEPMELTEPMEPMEPAEPMEEVEQEEEMEPRRKEIKIHRVGMGKGYGSSASSSAEVEVHQGICLQSRRRSPNDQWWKEEITFPWKGENQTGQWRSGVLVPLAPKLQWCTKRHHLHQEGSREHFRLGTSPWSCKSSKCLLSNAGEGSWRDSLHSQQRRKGSNGEQGNEPCRNQFGFQSQEGHRHQRAQNQSKLQSVHRQDKNELQSVHLRTQCRVVRSFLFTRWTGNPATQQWRNTSAGMRKSMLQDVPVQFLQETKQEPGNPRNLLVELHTFEPGTASEAKAVEQRVPAETRGLGPYNPGRDLGPYNPGWKMREMSQGAVPEDHLRRNDLLEARRHLQSQRDHHRSEGEQRKPLRSTRILLGGEQKGGECEKGARSQTLEMRKMNGEIGQDDEVDYQKEKAEIDYQEEKTEIDYQEESKFSGLVQTRASTPTRL